MTGRRVLFLTHSCPLPMVSGERIRTFNLMQQLASRGWQISLFSLVWGRPPDDRDRRTLHAMCESVVLEPFQPLRPARYARLVRNLVLSKGFQKDYFRSRSAVGRLAGLIRAGRFDVIMITQLYTYSWVEDEFHMMSVLDSHNVEERRLEALTEASVWVRGTVARLQLRAVRRLEREAIQRVRCTLAVSEVDRDHFERLAPGRIHLVPNGVDTSRLLPRSTMPLAPQILFLGSLSYSANVDAVRHLAYDILKHLQRPDASVVVVGINPPLQVHIAARRSPITMKVTGFVDDVRPYVEKSRMLVVPLRFGGGTRLKILEALAQGLPVVTTSIGCEGLNLVHERDLIIVDHPVEFARWIDRLLDDQQLCQRLALQGRRSVERHYDWSQIGDALQHALTECLR